jgi:hypothetical protein
MGDWLCSVVLFSPALAVARVPPGLCYLLFTASFLLLPKPPHALSYQTVYAGYLEHSESLDMYSEIDDRMR